MMSRLDHIVTGQWLILKHLKVNGRLDWDLGFRRVTLKSTYNPTNRDGSIDSTAP